MTVDDSSEIERLRRELEEVTAERDYLLAENHRLTQNYKGAQAPNQATTNKLVKEVSPPAIATKHSISTFSVHSESLSA